MVERNPNGRAYHMDLQWRLFYNRVNAIKRKLIRPLFPELPFEMCMVRLRIHENKSKAIRQGRVA